MRTVQEDVFRAAEIAERTGAPMLLNYAAAIAASWHAERGAHREAIEALELALATTQQNRTGVWDQPLYMARLACEHSALGAHEKARALAVGGLERSRQMHSGRESTLLSLANVLLNAGDTAAADEVESILTEAAERLDDSSWRAGRAQLHQERARLALWRGNETAARAEIGAAADVWREIGATGRLEQLRRICPTP